MPILPVTTNHFNHSLSPQHWKCHKKANSRVIAIHDWPFLKIELSQWSKYDHFFIIWPLQGLHSRYQKTDIEWNVFNYLEIQCFWNCIITWSAGWMMVFVSWFLLFVHRLSSLTKLGLEHLVSCISLHVISRLNDKQRPFSLVQQTESIFFRTCRVIWIFVLKIEGTIICL